jgi:hypothetical protein
LGHEKTKTCHDFTNQTNPLAHPIKIQHFLFPLGPIMPRFQ